MIVSSVQTCRNQATGDWITDVPLQKLGFEPSEHGFAHLNAFVATLEGERRQLGADYLWSVGREFDLTSLGVFGRTVCEAQRLGDALEALADGFHHIQSGAAVRFLIEDDAARLTYLLHDGRIWPRGGDAELTLGLFAGVLERFGLEIGDCLSVAVEHPMDDCLEDLGDALGRSIDIHATENSLTLPAGALSTALPTSKRAVHASDDTGRVEPATAPSLSQTIRQHIYETLEDGGYDQTRVADAICVSERSLRRKLAQAGVSYRDLLDDCREAAAVNLLRRRDLALADVGFRLGYSDQSTFSRAACRWFGMSPARYRAKIEAENASLAENAKTDRSG